MGLNAPGKVPCLSVSWTISWLPDQQLPNRAVRYSVEGTQIAVCGASPTSFPLGWPKDQGVCHAGASGIFGLGPAIAAGRCDDLGVLVLRWTNQQAHLRAATLVAKIADNSMGRRIVQLQHHPRTAVSFPAVIYHDRRRTTTLAVKQDRDGCASVLLGRHSALP